MKLELGRPGDCTGRLEKEIRTYDLLDVLGISYERVDHEAAETMEACREIDKILAPAVICKNLFFVFKDTMNLNAKNKWITTDTLYSTDRK